MMSPPCGNRAWVRVTGTVQPLPTAPILDESKPAMKVVGTPGLGWPGGADPLRTINWPPLPTSGMVPGPQVSSAAVGGEHVTGVGCPGCPNGPMLLAENPNCAGSFRAGPLLWTAIVAPVTWLVPKFRSVNCHCRIPLIDRVAGTASR